jgi:hypothetical protein
MGWNNRVSKSAWSSFAVLLSLTVACGPSDSEEGSGASQSALGMSAEAATAPRSTSAALADRIVVRLAVQSHDADLVLDLSAQNPYRCDWSGDIFVEREDAQRNVETVARLYQIAIPGGATWGVNLLVPQPAGPTVFLAKAYTRDGGDSEIYPPCLSAEPCVDSPESSVSLAQRTKVAVPAQVSRALSTSNLLPCPTTSPPIKSELDLVVHPDQIEVRVGWQNTTQEVWKGDLYVDMKAPDSAVTLLHRQIGASIDPGVGFSMVPVFVTRGPYVFSSRALRVDGAASAKWPYAGTTEITSVCNREVCELIQPEQERAQLTFTGPSWIYLNTDFFSESTTVSLAYGTSTFDITDRCRIAQYPGQPSTVEIQFDTMNLPIGPRTPARYTVSLHPMPVISPGTKTSDWLWVLTNGAE